MGQPQPKARSGKPFLAKLKRPFRCQVLPFNVIVLMPFSTRRVARQSFGRTASRTQQLAHSDLSTLVCDQLSTHSWVLAVDRSHFAQPEYHEELRKILG